MKRLPIIILFILLAFPHLAYAQTLEPYTDPCDQLPLRDWPDSHRLQAQNGVCVLQNASLGTGQLLMDFVVQFKLSLDPNGELVFSYGTSMNDEYELVVTPTLASLTNYIRFGNASNTVRDTLLVKALIDIPAGEWVDLEFGMQSDRQWLTVDGKKVIDRKTTRFNNVGITGKNGVYIDDIQLTRTNLSVNGEQLTSYPKDLAKTWIAFNNQQRELALVHPDGSGMQVIASPLMEIYGVQATFSPDGKVLLVNQGDGEKTLLRFYSLDTLGFVGTEIVLPRSPVYDWMSDSQHLIMLRDRRAKNPILEKINIQTGQIVETFPVPMTIDGQSIELDYISWLGCSPTDDIVSMYITLKMSGENDFRSILMNLINKQVHFLPGSEGAVWSPDGTFLFSPAGGLINSDSRVFTELPADMVKRIRGVGDWSANGQFIHTATKNAGNAQYEVSILDLKAQNVIVLPVIDFDTFAPDSQHFVFSDNGRVIVRSLFGSAERQIAEGYGGIWQPVSGLYPDETIQQPQSSVAPTRNIDSIIETQSDKVLATSLALADSDADSIPAISAETTEQKSTGSRWPSALFALGTIGIIFAIILNFLHRFRICSFCKKPNQGSDPFCMYCGTAFPSKTQIVNVRMIRMIRVIGIVFGGIAIIGLAGLLIALGQSTASPSESVDGSQVIQQNTPVRKPSESPVNPVSGFSCGMLPDLATTDLLTVLKTSDTTQKDLASFFAQRQTPEANPTTQGLRQGSWDAEFEELMGRVCSISFFSFSPEEKYILVSGTSASSETGYWTAIYDRSTYQPLWVKSVKVEQLPFDEILWNPTGETFAVNSLNLGDEEAITIYDTRTGNPISKIPASTRTGAECSPFNDEGQFRWLSDGKRLIRKVANAVQILDSETGAVIEEIAFNDGSMGSPISPPDNYNCLFHFGWTADGSQFATLDGALGLYDDSPVNKLKIWDAVAGRLVIEMNVGAREGVGILFSPDGTKLFLPRGHTSPPAQIIDTNSGQVLHELSECSICKQASTILWSPDSQRLLLHENNILAVYNLSTQSWNEITLDRASSRVRLWGEHNYVLLSRQDLFSNELSMLNIESGIEISLMEYFKLLR